MNQKFILACVALVTIGTVCKATDLIDLNNDKNRNAMTMDLIRSLKSVQEALRGEFQFQSVADARLFLSSCKYIKVTMKSANNDDYEGLAEQVKSIMAKPELVRACAISPKVLGEYESLDTEYDVLKSHYLWPSKFDKLLAMRASLEENDDAKLLLTYLIEHTFERFAEALLENAVSDLEIIAGEKAPPTGLLDFSQSYLKKCNMQKLKPICRAVRPVPVGEVESNASGSDLADYAQLIASRDQEKLSASVKQSGVSGAEVQVACEKLDKRILGPMKLLDKFQAAGIINNNQVEDKLASDADFHFYYNLNQLCKSVLAA